MLALSEEESDDSMLEEIGAVYCFTHLKGGNTTSRVTHVWSREGEEKARIELNVRSASWRTWSSKRIPAHWAGEWKVVVLDAAGKEIGTTNFTVGG